MTDQSRFPNALLDDAAKLATNAAGVLQGAREEFEAAVNARIERWLAERDLVTREEFEAVRAVSIAAREETERLAERLAALESRE